MSTLAKPTGRVPPQVFLAKVPEEPMAISSSQVRKNRQNTLNFFYCVQPVYIVSRLYGFMPFSFKFNSNAEVIGYEVKPIDLIWFIISLFNYTIMAYLCWSTVTTQQSGVSFVLFVGNRLLIVVGLLFGAVAVALDMFNRHRLVDITRNFNVFDKKMQKMGLNLDYGRIRRKIRIWFGCSTLLAVFLLVATFASNHSIRSNHSEMNVLVYYSTHCVYYGSWSIVLTKFFFLLISLFKRLEQINILLEDRFMNEKSTRETYLTEMNLIDTKSFVKKIGEMYDNLCGTMDLINFTFSFQVMVTMAANFLFSLLTFYSLYRHFTSPNDDFREIAIVHFNWEIFHSVYTFSTVFNSASVTREAKRTATIIHRIINEIEDKDIAASLMQLSQQIQHRIPIATCGLFPFDWTLCFTMVGATTSYVTLLIQFDNHKNGANLGEQQF